MHGSHHLSLSLFVPRPRAAPALPRFSTALVRLLADWLGLVLLSTSDVAVAAAAAAAAAD